jgi:hypothetical protein
MCVKIITVPLANIITFIVIMIIIIIIFLSFFFFLYLFIASPCSGATLMFFNVLRRCYC